MSVPSLQSNYIHARTLVADAGKNGADHDLILSKAAKLPMDNAPEGIGPTPGYAVT